MSSSRQCTLSRGRESMVSWIPARFALLGTELTLRVGSAWQGGWVVQGVHGLASEETVSVRGSSWVDYRQGRDYPQAKVDAVMGLTLAPQSPYWVGAR